jgi:hypothetical protein
MDVVGRVTHEHREVGGKVTPGAVTEDAQTEGNGEGGHKYFKLSLTYTPHPVLLPLIRGKGLQKYRRWIILR